MNVFAQRHESNSLSSRAFGVPAPHGWLRFALGCLTVWLVGNFLWIAGGLVVSRLNAAHAPPPGWVYWSVWCSGGTAIAALLVACVLYLRLSGWLWFFSLTAAMCVLEECSATRPVQECGKAARASGPSSASASACS